MLPDTLLIHVTYNVLQALQVISPHRIGHHNFTILNPKITSSSSFVLCITLAPGSISFVQNVTFLAEFPHRPSLAYFSFHPALHILYSHDFVAKMAFFFTSSSFTWDPYFFRCRKPLLFSHIKPQLAVALFQVRTSVWGLLCAHVRAFVCVCGGGGGGASVCAYVCVWGGGGIGELLISIWEHYRPVFIFET